MIIRNDLPSTTKHAVVREQAAAPVNFVFEFGLRRDSDRDKPRSALCEPEPAVVHDRFVISPTPGKFEILGYAEDVEVFVGPHFAVARYAEGFAKREEHEIADGFEHTNAIFGIGAILEDLYLPPVDNRERCDGSEAQDQPESTARNHRHAPKQRE